MFFRIHSKRVSEAEFLTNARTWAWEFDDEGRLVEAKHEGYYSATETARDLVRYLNGNAAADEPIAVFEGEEADYTPQTDCRGEVWVAPTRLVKWITVADLEEEAREEEE